MTFCSKEQNKNEIISSVKINNNSFTINYLNNRENFYFKNFIEERDRIEEIMLRQAKERDDLEYLKTSINKWGSFISWIVANVCFSNLMIKDLLFFSICFFLLVTIFFILSTIYGSKLNELKKYRILLENYNEIKKYPELSKLIEFDSYYRNDINIFNIDKITLSDMKYIKRFLKKIR